MQPFLELVMEKVFIRKSKGNAFLSSWFPFQKNDAFVFSPSNNIFWCFWPSKQHISIGHHKFYCLVFIFFTVVSHFDIYICYDLVVYKYLNKEMALFFPAHWQCFLFIFIFQTQKGKVHGSIDVGLSVMSIKKKARRIDLDTEEHIYHLKVRNVSH